MEQMKISGYTDEEFKNPLPGAAYTVMINPESIKVQRTIEYNKQQAPNSRAPSQKYKSTPSDKLSFDFTIDCTGVVDPDRTNMASEIRQLETIVSKYNGKIHRPNFVKIQWGKAKPFNGVLTSLDIAYTLFRPDGSPLRAKVTIAFTQYISVDMAEKEAKLQSPDVSHLVTVSKGVTLPQLCQSVWENDSYYIQAARYNKLNKFRNLKGGEKLIFPPLVQSVS
jgi:hypothetical protein